MYLFTCSHRPPPVPPASMSPGWGCRGGLISVAALGSRVLERTSAERSSGPPLSSPSAPLTLTAVHCSVPVLFPRTCPYLSSPPIGPKTGASLEGPHQSTEACPLRSRPTLPPTASQSGASLARAVQTPRGGANGRGRVALPARGAGSWEAPPRPGSKSGGRRARMWRVTLNCSRSQTPGLPARPRSPAALLPRRGPRPPRPHARISWVLRSSFTAGHPAPDAGPTAVPTSPRSLYLSCRRRGTAALPRGRAAGRTLQPGSATPPPRLLPYSPLSSPPFLGARPAITWMQR